MRVFHCIYDDPDNPWLGGGGARRVWEIYRRLAGRVRATVVAGRYPGARDHEREGVQYRYLGRPRPYALSRWSFARAATRLLQHAEYDAAVFDFSVYTPLRVPADRPVGHVVHMLIGPTAMHRWGRTVGGLVLRRERHMLAQARVVSTTSHWMERQLRALLPPDADLTIVRSGVSEEFFQVRREEKGYLLFYGRFDLFQKGVDTLMEAFRQVRQVRPDIELHMAGRGQHEEIQRMAVAAGVEGSVHIHGGVSHERVLELFSGASLLVMPSRFEGLPVVAAEALAAGVPVLATDVGALDEIVTPDETGVLLPPERPGAMADAILGLLADPERRHRMSQAARESARRFRWAAVAEDHYEFLSRVQARPQS